MKNPDTNDQLYLKEPARQEAGQEKQKDASSRTDSLRKRFRHMFLMVLFMAFAKTFGCATVPETQPSGKIAPVGSVKTEQAGKDEQRADKIRILREKLGTYVKDKLFLRRFSELVYLYNEIQDGSGNEDRYEDRLAEFTNLYGVSKKETGDLVSGFVQSEELKEMTREFEESFKEIDVGELLTPSDIEDFFPPKQPPVEVSKDPSVKNSQR